MLYCSKCEEKLPQCSSCLGPVCEGTSDPTLNCFKACEGKEGCTEVCVVALCEFFFSMFVFRLAAVVPLPLPLQEFSLRPQGSSGLKGPSSTSTSPSKKPRGQVHTALHLILLHCTSLRCLTLHCTALHCTALDCTALNCTALNCTAPCCSTATFLSTPQKTGCLGLGWAGLDCNGPLTSLMTSAGCLQL